MDELQVPTVIDTVLLKVASRCNLSCSYCYVYHMGDEGWRRQPKQMSAAVQLATVRQLAALYCYQDRPLSVVLHGGEPLLIGTRRLRRLCRQLRRALPAPCGVHVQTNGVLLTDEIIDIFVEFNVGVSISIDGPPAVHDRLRVDHGGAGSHQRVIRAIRRLTSRRDAAPLFAGVLAVIDPTSRPDLVYAALKETGAPSIDFLVRDGNHVRLPPGKTSARSTEYGRWMVGLLNVYLSDPEPPRVRVLDDMLRLILGGQAQKEGGWDHRLWHSGSRDGWSHPEERYVKGGSPGRRSVSAKPVVSPLGQSAGCYPQPSVCRLLPSTAAYCDSLSRLRRTPGLRPVGW